MNTIKKVFSSDDDKKNVASNGPSTGISSPSQNNSSVANGASATHTGGASDILHAHASPQDDGKHSHQHTLQKHAHVPGDDAAHDHRHLAAVTKEKQHHHQTEEVAREREVDRHIHHVQHHVQPVLDTQHHDREHSEKVHEPTKIHEQHVNTETDHKLFAGLNKHKDSVVKGDDHSKVIDRGETVHENTSHHVHHVVQPVIERDSHTHHTVHTTIPVHQTTHEAPIIHQSSTHEPMHLKDFVSSGGDLKSKLTHDNAGVLAGGDCARDVQGPGEKLAEKLGLGHGSHSHGTTGAIGGTTGATTGVTGGTGTAGHTANTGTNGVSNSFNHEPAGATGAGGRAV